MSTSGLLSYLDTSLTELELLEKMMEIYFQAPDARQWPTLSLGVRKLATASVELMNMPEIRNRTNRAPFLGFCARFKALSLMMLEVLAQSEIKSSSPTNRSVLQKSSSPATSSHHNHSKQWQTLPPGAINPTKKESSALLLPELQQLIQQLSQNSPDLVVFEWNHESKLGRQGIGAVIEPLNWRNTNLKILKLSNNNLGDMGLMSVGKALKTNRSITELDVSMNSITAKGVEELVDALLMGSGNSPNNILKRLDLGHNLLDFASCGFIARLLTNLFGLTELYLNNNLIDDVGITSIGNALSLNCGLQRLDLQENPCSQNFAAGPIFETVLLQSNYDLQYLNLGSAKASQEELLAIENHLNRNREISKNRSEAIISSLNCLPSASTISTSSTTYQLACENALLKVTEGSKSRMHVFHQAVLSPSSLLRIACAPNSNMLTMIVATDYNLTTLPPQLCLLGAHLEVLDLRRNKLTEIPVEIKAFFKLHTLHLAHNRLQHLPREITELVSLGTISLQGNPLNWIPQEVVKHGEIEDYLPTETSLFKFLKSSASIAEVPDYDNLYGRIMVMGGVHSGKTSLIQVLESENGREGALSWVQLMPRYTSTEGIHIRNISIRGSKYKTEGLLAMSTAVTPEQVVVCKMANFQVWECGGSPIFAASHSIFFSPDMLYIITVDLPKIMNPSASEDAIASIRSNIKSIQTIVGSKSSAPFIAIVGTFEDMMEPKQLSDILSILQAHFSPHVLEILAVSNKSARGFPILRDRVLLWAFKSKLFQTPQVGSISTIQKVLKSYATIRPFISRLELEQICKCWGVGIGNKAAEAEKASNPSILAALASVEPSQALIDLQSTTLRRNASQSSIILPPIVEVKDVVTRHMSVDYAITLLEHLGAVLTLHGDTHLQSYAFIDIQFVCNIFSDVMASADADGYIYRSHIPPLLWMDCRKYASMKSLFDWCRLFGLAIDCGNTHFIIPNLLNSHPNVSVYNSAWPAMPYISGISSRPHLDSDSPRSQPLLSPIVSPRSFNANPSGRPAHTRMAVASSAKDVQKVLRAMSSLFCPEWVVLTRGLVTDFVPPIVFSHIMSRCFALPGIQRCAWWKRGFVVRRDYQFAKVTLKKDHSNDDGTDSSPKDGKSNAYNPVKVLIRVRNDSTYTASTKLLEEIVLTIQNLLQHWYPQIEYEWTVPWTHPHETVYEQTVIPLKDIEARIATGVGREPTLRNGLFIREELLVPELVDYSKYQIINEKSLGTCLPSQTSNESDIMMVKGEDGTSLRIHKLPSIEAAQSRAATITSLHNPRIATFSGIIQDLPGVAVVSTSTGSLYEVLLKTCSNEPLSWFVRLRIMSDLALALKYLHYQVPLIAFQGIDTQSVILENNYGDVNAKGALVRLDLGLLNSQRWLKSIYRPPPFVPSNQAAQAATSQYSPTGGSLSASSSRHQVILNNLSTVSSWTSKLSPHSVDIYSLGVLFLQLWRNETTEEFVEKGKQLYKKSNMNTSCNPSGGSMSTSGSTSPSAGTMSPSTSPPPSYIDRGIDSLNEAGFKLPPVPFFQPDNIGYAQLEQLIACCVCEDPRMRPSVDHILSKLKLIASKMEHPHLAQMLSSTTSTKNWKRMKTIQLNTNVEVYHTITSIVKTTFISSANDLDETLIWFGGVSGVLHGIPLPTPSSSYSIVSLASITPAVLESAAIKYKMQCFPPDTRDSKKRIISSATTSKYIWSLLNSTIATVLEPTTQTMVAQVEVGACLCISASDDTVYTGGTNGIVTAWDGSSFKKFSSREVSNLPITAIVASYYHVWVAVADQQGGKAQLICLDALSLKEVGRITHPEEETVSALLLVKQNAPNTQGSEYLWAGGYSGMIQTFKILTAPFDSKSEFATMTHLSYAVHSSRLQQLAQYGGLVYSSAEDQVVIWKPDASAIVSKIVPGGKDISCFCVLEENVIITGLKMGAITFWSS